MNTAPNTSHRAGAGDQLALFAGAILPSARARHDEQELVPQEEPAGEPFVAANAAAIVQPFKGTKRPRLLHLMRLLMARRLTRRQVDFLMECVNGPQLICDLRCLGLEIPNTQFSYPGHDGRTKHGSYYALTPLDKLKLNLWQAACNG